MKATYHSIVVLIIGFSNGLFGCQEEFQEIISPVPTATISGESGSGLLLSRISKLDGSADNIIDSSSCTSIVFPFTVTVNGVSIEIRSEDDYDLLEDIIDDIEDEEGRVTIQFPVNVVLNDHSTKEANDMEELEDLIEACDEEDYIDCVNIVYPVTFSSYNDATQQAGTTTIENDTALYRFIDGIEDREIVSLNYPVELILSTGETITVENNEELETFIELYEDSCDDDNDDDDEEDDEEDDDDNNEEEDDDEEDDA